MNIRGAAGGAASGDGSGSPSDAGYSAALVDVGRKMLAMDALRLRPIRTTGPSPVAHNGRYWTPDRRRDNAETVRYIRCLVQTCEAIKPWTAAGYQTSSVTQTRTKVTMDQLPRIMQKVSELGGRVGNLWQVVSALVYVTLQIMINYTSDYGENDIMISKNVFIALYEI